MKPQTALLKLMGVLFGVFLLCGGLLIGAGALFAHQHSETLHEVRKTIHMRSLGTEEKLEVITGRIEQLDGVDTAQVTESQWDTTKIRVTSSSPVPGDDLKRQISDICDSATRFWPGFLDPHHVDCIVAGG